MKKSLYLFLLLLLTGLQAQKNNNGKIYDEHPAIDFAESFLEAYVAGDENKLRSMATDDFIAYNALTTNKDDKGNSIDVFVNQSKYWSSNLLGFSLNRRGSSYPDALEYKRSGLVVYTFDVFRGFDKTTGFKFDMPFDCTFFFNKEGTKIKNVLIQTNMRLFQKYQETFETMTNGTLYKGHPDISKVRKMLAHLELGNFDSIFEDFTDTSRFYDINMPYGTFMSLEENKASLKSGLERFEIESIDEVGYPDLLDYEGSQHVVISWWTYRLKEKKKDKRIKLSVHLQHTFNNDGKITSEISYYNGSLLE